MAFKFDVEKYKRILFMIRKDLNLNNGQVVTIREGEKEDAGRVLEYVNRIAGETDHLTFGPGEFKFSLEQEEKFIESHLNSDNKTFYRCRNRPKACWLSWIYRR